jgi:hypothetical protein
MVFRASLCCLFEKGRTKNHGEIAAGDPNNFLTVAPLIDEWQRGELKRKKIALEVLILYS